MAIIRRRRSNGSIAYGVQVFVNGEPSWEGTRNTEREAKQLEREALSRTPTRGHETIEEFCSRYLDDFNWKGERWGTETLKTVRYALTNFKQTFGRHKLSRPPRDELRIWALERPFSDVRAVRALFNDAVDKELTPANPLHGLKVEKSRGRRDIIALEFDEVNLLADCARAKCGDWFSNFLFFQGIQGLRPIATAEVRPQDVGSESLYVRKPGKKVGARTVYLFPQVAERLARMPRELHSEYLFTTPQGAKLSKTNLTFWFNKVVSMFESKLDPRREAELRDARPRGTSLTLYECRHAAATIQLRWGLTPQQVAWNLGHTDGGELVNRLYGHPSDQDRIDSVKRSLGQAGNSMYAYETGGEEVHDMQGNIP